MQTIAFDYVINDFNFYPAPNIQKPLKGLTFQDPNFHTEVVRITDALSELPKSKRYGLYQGYPKHDIENADGTKLIMQSWSEPSAWHIWNANPTYGKYKDIPYRVIGKGRPIDCRWDDKDPNILYFQMKRKFWKLNIETMQASALHDFSSEYIFTNGTEWDHTMSEEGTPSSDSRYWAFRIYAHNKNHSPRWWHYATMVFDKDYYGKDQGKVIAKIDRTNPNFREAGFTSMSPSGKYVWIGDAHYIYSRDLAAIRTGKLGKGHADMGYSAEGREVIFGYALKDGNWSNGYWAAMEDLETGKLTYLARPLGLPMFHFSANSHEKPGWGVVSQPAPRYPGVESKLYEHEVFMVELTTRTNPPPRVWRLAKTHTVRKGYNDDIYAKINKKGTKVWFGTGWGTSFYDVGGAYDVYQINLPSTWYQDLISTVPLSPPKYP